jgi:glycosyltransferase involved in cell wall biosynthesis
MKIAFDAKRAYLNSSGLGSYSRTLIKSLNEFHLNNEYTLYTTKVSNGPFQQYIDTQKNISVHQPSGFIAKKTSALWRTFGITKLLNETQVDVFHGLSNELPVNISQFKGKKIVTIHDLIFLEHPNLYPYIDRKIYDKKFRHACDVADTIIAISDETKRDIEKLYKIPSNKIEVVYQSCSELYYNDAPAEQKKAIIIKHKLPKEFLLYVGTVEERKNLLSIVKALLHVKDIPLVVVGRQTAYFNTVKAFIEEHNLQNRVLFLGSVAGEDLPPLYQLATIFILPSIMEGFGIPIIEAQTSRTPVITTRGGCFGEAGGPHSIYINPTDVNALAENINYLLDNPAEREKIIDAGVAYSQKFHPAIITQQLIDIYKK